MSFSTAFQLRGVRGRNCLLRLGELQGFCTVWSMLSRTKLKKALR
jgi:hypothetical protein